MKRIFFLPVWIFLGSTSVFSSEEPLVEFAEKILKNAPQNSSPLVDEPTNSKPLSQDRNTKPENVDSRTQEIFDVFQTTNKTIENILNPEDPEKKFLDALRANTSDSASSKTPDLASSKTPDEFKSKIPYLFSSFPMFLPNYVEIVRLTL